MKINLITTLSICWLYNHIVHNEVAFNIWGLIFLNFRLRNLSINVLVNSILKQNLHFAHLEFCLSDLDWIWLDFAISSCLVFNSTIGLPRRLLLSIKLFSKLWSCLVNLWTYWLILKWFIGLIDKSYSVFQGILLDINLTWI